MKLMIADKTAIVVNEIFDNYYSYSGCDYLVAGVLYSVQLYADFLSCTSFAQGISALFGIKLSDNFKHPYFSISIKDFWRRWHITFSEWLRDYIYIPLGGNRKGRVRQKLNLIIVFAVSGLWHGPGVNYLCWGLMHGIYQIVGSATYYFRERVYQVLHIEEGNVIKKYNKIIWTFIFVMFAWIIFRAENLTIGIHMIRSIFNTHNIWALFDDSLLTLGLSWKEYVILGISIWIMKKVSSLQESGICIRDYILSQHIILRWIIYILAIAAIVTFGSYGYGFDQQAFIYGGF